MNNNNNNNENNANANNQDQQLLEFEALILPFQFGMNNFNFFLDQIPLLRVDTVPSLDRYSRVFRFSDRLSEHFLIPPSDGAVRRDSMNSPRMKNQNHEKYLQKRKQSIQNDKLDTSKPHIKITALRNINLNSNYNQFFVNEFGLIGSQKNADSEDIIIGRSHRIQSQDIIPNDIMLPEDRIISRLHCKLVCKDYFRKDQRLELHYKKLLDNIRLPAYAKKIISSFLEEPKNTYIQDLGSVCGTHMKVLRSEPHLVKQDQKYSIGSDTTFVILESKPFEFNNKQIDGEWFSLLRNLANLKLQQKHEIHFSDPKNANIFSKIEAEATTDQAKDIYTKLKFYQPPLLIVKFNGQGVEMNKIYNVFVGSAENYSIEFQIGRGQENNVKINSNTISRKQSRLKYLHNKLQWAVGDGSGDRDSANGTWINLSTIEQSEKKMESNLIKVENNAEIKISDFILRIELLKGINPRGVNLIRELLAD